MNKSRSSTSETDIQHRYSTVLFAANSRMKYPLYFTVSAHS
ncbi:hypothetical protein SOVF_072130 [Spinacia oleracea]|nr:hypothetical protein SOVF_072130 [Spinacia oleracea]